MRAPPGDVWEASGSSTIAKKCSNVRLRTDLHASSESVLVVIFMLMNIRSSRVPLCRKDDEGYIGYIISICLGKPLAASKASFSPLHTVLPLPRCH